MSVKRARPVSCNITIMIHIHVCSRNSNKVHVLVDGLLVGNVSNSLSAGVALIAGCLTKIEFKFSLRNKMSYTRLQVKPQ